MSGLDLPCSVALLEDDLTTYLATWESLGPVGGWCYLAGYLQRNHNALMAVGAPALDSLYWERRATQQNQLIAWLKASNVREAVRTAALTALSDERLAGSTCTLALAHASDLLDMLATPAS